jgi:hypothetical protein
MGGGRNAGFAGDRAGLGRFGIKQTADHGESALRRRRYKHGDARRRPAGNIGRDENRGCIQTVKKCRVALAFDEYKRTLPARRRRRDGRNDRIGVGAVGKLRAGKACNLARRIAS